MLAELQFGSSASFLTDREWLPAYARQVVLLQHPTLLRVFDVCIDDQNQWALVRQAMPGNSRWVYDRSITENRDELQTISSILLSVSEALSYLHQRQFRGGNFSAWHEAARITELAGELHFGMNPPTPEEAFQNTDPQYMGCISYSAPEALGFYSEGFVYQAPTWASDSFSLGALLFELLSGKRLVSENGMGGILQIVSGQFPELRNIRPDLPAQLINLVSRALSQSPEARPSLREWGFVMEDFGGRLLTPPPSSAPASRSGDTPTRKTPGLVSVLTDEATNQRINIIGSLGEGGHGTEYLIELLDEDPVAEETTAVVSESAAASEKPLYMDENVQFTVYRPKAILPQKWYSLLAFAHLSEKRDDASEAEPDPVEEVRNQAKQLLGEQASDYQNLTQDTLQAVPREGTITFVPTMPGIEFNPPSRSFVWEESVHREDFRVRAAASSNGQVVRGRMSVFLGSILLADIPLSIRVDTHTARKQKMPLEEIHARPYRKIFASYSHRDIKVVEQFEHFVEALGDRYLRDVRYLRAGEEWSEKLEEMIRAADVFQLFWSSNSMGSPFVKQEWEFALALRRPNFIRPTYWEDPLPMQPDKKLPPEELTRLHFQRIGGEYGTQLTNSARDEDEVKAALDVFSSKRPREKAAQVTGSFPVARREDATANWSWADTQRPRRQGVGGGAEDPAPTQRYPGAYAGRSGAAGPRLQVPSASHSTPSVQSRDDYYESARSSGRSGAGGPMLGLPAQASGSRSSLGDLWDRLFVSGLVIPLAIIFLVLLVVVLYFLFRS